MKIATGAPSASTLVVYHTAVLAYVEEPELLATPIPRACGCTGWREE